MNMKMWKPSFNDVIDLKEKWSYQVEDLLGGQGKFPLYAFRCGTGRRNALFIARIHGHEPAGTSGIIMFLNSIIKKMDLDGNDISSFVERLFSEFTLHFVPMVNVDAAIRYEKQVKESYPGNIFSENETDYLVYKNILTSPARDLYNDINIRSEKISQVDLKKIDFLGIALGTLYSESGIELFYDWKRRDSRQIEELTTYMNNYKMDYFVDIHCHELPSNIYIPMTAESRNDSERFKLCGNYLLEQLRANGLACSSNSFITSYKTGIPVQYAHDLLYDSLGIASFLWEINVGYTLPKKLLPEKLKNSPERLRKKEITTSVYCLISNFLDYHLVGSENLINKFDG
jgi:Zinc carboxypeptidase